MWRQEHTVQCFARVSSAVFKPIWKIAFVIIRETHILLQVDIESKTPGSQGKIKGAQAEINLFGKKNKQKTLTFFKLHTHTLYKLNPPPQKKPHNVPKYACKFPIYI